MPSSTSNHRLDSYLGQKIPSPSGDLQCDGGGESTVTTPTKHVQAVFNVQAESKDKVVNFFISQLGDGNTVHTGNVSDNQVEEQCPHDARGGMAEEVSQVWNEPLLSDIMELHSNNPVKDGFIENGNQSECQELAASTYDTCPYRGVYRNGHASKDRCKNTRYFIYQNGDNNLIDARKEEEVSQGVHTDISEETTSRNNTYMDVDLQADARSTDEKILHSPVKSYCTKNVDVLASSVGNIHINVQSKFKEPCPDSNNDYISQLGDSNIIYIGQESNLLHWLIGLYSLIKRTTQWQE